jgi:HAD superfamily hydrolase (TIGR01509 family)
MVPLTAVLFDFNGVLVDDEHLHQSGFNDVLAPLGITMTDEAYRERYLGFDDRGAFAAVLRDSGRDVDDSLVRDLIARKAEVYRRRALAELRVYPGAAALLRSVARTSLVGIVSGALRGEIDLALDVMSARDAVRFVVAAEDVTACKPDPEGYLAALARVRAERTVASPRSVIAIEDSIAGIQSARAAGLSVLAVAHTYERAALETAGAHAVIATIAEVTVDSLARVAAR